MCHLFGDGFRGLFRVLHILDGEGKSGSFLRYFASSDESWDSSETDSLDISVTLGYFLDALDTLDALDALDALCFLVSVRSLREVCLDESSSVEFLSLGFERVDFLYNGLDGLENLVEIAEFFNNIFID